MSALGALCAIHDALYPGSAPLEEKLKAYGEFLSVMDACAVVPAARSDKENSVQPIGVTQRENVLGSIVPKEQPTFAQQLKYVNANGKCYDVIDSEKPSLDTGVWKTGDKFQMLETHQKKHNARG
jgi:hypothetical protein